MLNKVRAREGYETEYDEIRAEMTRLEEGADDDEDDVTRLVRNENNVAVLRARLDIVGLTVYEAIGAPKLGDTPETIEHFRKIYDDNHAEVVERPSRYHEAHIAQWSRPFEEVLEEFRGTWMPDLAPDSGGDAKVTGIAAGRFDFRGKCVGNSEALIGNELANEAYENHTGEEALDYGSRLMAKVRELREAGTLEVELSNIEAGAQWLCFWGSRGFGFYAWF